MTDYFVWAGASGNDSGDSWANAAPSLMIDWGATITPGTDQVYVRSTHVESTAGALTLLGSTAEGTTAPVDIRCVVGADTGTVPGNLAKGATVDTTSSGDMFIDENVYIYGVDFTANDDLFIGSATDANITFEDCVLSSGVNNGDDVIIGREGAFGSWVTFLNTDISAGSDAGGTVSFNGGNFTWLGGTLTTNHTNFFDMPRTGRAYVQNVDFSVLTGALVGGASNSGGHIIFRRCLLGTGATIISGTIDVPGLIVESFHCQIGTDTDPAFQMETHTDRGSVTHSTDRYRTGGASDGERTNPISWKMTTDVGSKRSYPGHALESPAIAGWTDGDGSTAHTYRIYFASDATQDNDELWFILTGPNDAAINSLGVMSSAGLVGTRVDPETISAAHTSDSGSTWTGSDVATKQYMSITYTPDKPGPISAVLYCAGVAGTTKDIYFDPKIYIDP